MLTIQCDILTRVRGAVLHVRGGSIVPCQPVLIDLSGCIYLKVYGSEGSSIKFVETHTR